jgi:EAL and modified HD-GYP domain-containing signal transduction protein
VDNTAETMPKEIPSQEIFLARQPIVDVDLSVMGYEILFNDKNTEEQDNIDAETSSQVLLNSLIDIGLKELIGDSQAFIPISDEHVLGKRPIPTELEHVSMQILDGIVATDTLVETIKELKHIKHYPVSLSEFQYDDSKKELVELADYVKLNITKFNDQEMEDQIRQLKNFDIKIIAEQVETQDDFDRCKEMGFDYFQGLFLCSPRIIKGQRTPSSRLAILHLLNELQDPEISFDALEKLIEKDVALSYRILHYINSAFYSLSKPVDTLKKATKMLGLKNIKIWVTIIAQSKFDDKPYELMITSLIRGKMCEIIAERLKINNESVFIIGLFSTLDALLDKPMNEILDSLPLTDEVNNALLQHEGPLGNMLAWVLAYEKGQWDIVEESGLESQAWKTAYLDSIQWTREVGNALLARNG